MTAGFFALAGVALGFLGQWWLQARRRADTVAALLRTDRREAYSALLVSVNESAHQLARVAPEHGYGTSGDAAAREKAAYAFDQDVTPSYRVVELVGTPGAVDAAKEMRTRLQIFRDILTLGRGPATRL